MKLILRDLNPRLIAAWTLEFEGCDDVTVEHCGIFDHDVKADAIISPANSFGFMDGGIDLVYSNHFGWKVSRQLQNEIQLNWCGEIPIGMATIVPTGNENIPSMICAPTMRVPMQISNTVNAYLAFRAALLVAKQMGLQSLLCPGLGTATGLLDEHYCAAQMKAAWDREGITPRFNNLISAKQDHIWMRKGIE